MQTISIPFGYIMRFCYELLSNYGLAIILFTLITKIILFPISLWTQNNSVKLVKIQPKLNKIKAKYYGEKDKISDEQLILYKQEKYNPFIGIIPMVIQIFLLICLIQIIYNPLTHILAMDKSTIDTLVKTVCDLTGADPQSSSIQLTVVTEIQNGLSIPNMDLSAIKSLNMGFFIFDLSSTPMKSKGIMLLIPVLAGAFSLLLSLSQNYFNPLQAEQNKFTQYSTAAVSVGISLILGGFVPAGVGFYWIFSNIFSILQQFLLNVIINPKKHIDYEELEESRKELSKISNIGKNSSPKFGDENYKRQKKDYKRFFSVANKHLVIYSESNGFYKYFEPLINYLNEHSNIVIHYITSDPNDKIFEKEKENEKIRAYYFSEKKMITVFMKMDADIVLMTMPDIDNYHYKRSYIKKDVEYIYCTHGPMSTHMVMNFGCLDHFDTIFCVGDFQISEIRKQEEITNSNKKNLVVCGYGFLETLKGKYDLMPKSDAKKKKILIAPSWQEDNILDSCIDKILDELLYKGYNVVIRPHPEYMKRFPQRIEELVSRYSNVSNEELQFELDFTNSSSIYDSDVLITDWSSVAFEFSYVTLKPSVFINTPMKVYNKRYKEIGIEPLEIILRDKIGKSFDIADLENLNDSIQYMTNNVDKYSSIIENVRNKYIANFGSSAEVEGKYIINSLINKKKGGK